MITISKSLPLKQVIMGKYYTLHSLAQQLNETAMLTCLEKRIRWSVISEMGAHWDGRRISRTNGCCGRSMGVDEMNDHLLPRMFRAGELAPLIESLKSLACFSASYKNSFLNSLTVEVTIGDWMYLQIFSKFSGISLSSFSWMK